jgi:hypothetical protein
MGHVALMRAKVSMMLGRNDDGSRWFARAAGFFEKAGEPENAGDCRARSEDLEVRLAADLDRLTERSLRALLSSAALSDPLERAAALVQLSGACLSAGDMFEAERNAEAATAALKRLGLPECRPGPMSGRCRKRSVGRSTVTRSAPCGPLAVPL